MKSSKQRQTEDEDKARNDMKILEAPVMEIVMYCLSSNVPI